MSNDCHIYKNKIFYTIPFSDFKMYRSAYLGTQFKAVQVDKPFTLQGSEIKHKAGDYIGYHKFFDVYFHVEKNTFENDFKLVLCEHGR